MKRLRQYNKHLALYNFINKEIIRILKIMKKIAILIPLLGSLVILTGCLGKKEPTGNQNNGAPANANQTSKAASKVPSELIGTWKSACLTPDQNSPWSEQHQFVIDGEGWATHIRWDWDVVGCTGTMNTQTDEYLIEFPSAGKISLIDMGKGNTINDAYQLTGDTLLFGHGFRNNLSYTATYNEYIRYQKVK